VPVTVRRLGVVGLCVAIAGIAAWRITRGDTVRDVGVRLDLVKEGAFRLRLGGRLWRDRTLRDQDGVPDVAYVSQDEPLVIEVTGRKGRKPVSVEVQVDGISAVRRRLCDASPCPTSAQTSVTPAVRARGPGTHRLTVIARGAARHPAVSTRFEITIANAVPVTREGEPVAVRAAPSPGPSVEPAELRRTLAIIDRERRSGVLRTVIGAAPYGLVEVGYLEAGSRRIGTTALVSLARGRVRGTSVPSYVPAPNGGSYRMQTVALSAPVLRDLLIDVDLERGRVIAVDPGPESTTSQWKPGTAAVPTGSRDED
jgi:hypothetical protein